MLLPASQEYISLCQSQVKLLMQGLRASEIAVYMTEQLEMTGDASLKPLVVFPDVSQVWPDQIQWQLEGTQNSISPLILEPASDGLLQEPERIEPLRTSTQESAPSYFGASQNVEAAQNNLEAERFQLILPLRHDNAVLGVLMVARLGEPWSDQDQEQVEQVANSLSLACVLDQRSQWLSQSGYEKQALLTEEHQRLGKLLHQFRNPLTALRTLGKLMVRRMTGEDPNRNFAESIVQQSDRLELMLREFSQTLDLGEETIEALDDNWSLLASEQNIPLLPSAGVISGGELQLQPCWISEILETIVSAAVGRLEERNLTLNYELSEDLPPVSGDSQALNEVFSNLIDNAIKYTPDGGRIEVILLQNIQPNLGVSVQKVFISDSGYGVPQEDLEKIFMGKYRGIQEQSTIPGTGLGLSIVRDLLHRMNGRIQAFSPAMSPRNESPTQPISLDCPGSTFVVTLPQKNG